MGFKNDNQVRFPVEFLPQFTNDSAEQEQPLRDCPSQRFNKPDSYHNLFIVSWITRKSHCIYMCSSGEVKCKKECPLQNEHEHNDQNHELGTDVRMACGSLWNAITSTLKDYGI
ncbi:hypothetical protein T4B_12275 [Trichinella pseudospiralis]|uniref:Uncharacterized protein n=1 Tax=Trichinella pseudospiralis TaxID=6337 RepID=A0A0V1HWA5_TRIPS|nr:hypothetical protein T4B_12275 [Trichinella pseudospiralis]